MILTVPISPVPNQEFRILLGTQRCYLHLYERRLRDLPETHRMYMDAYVNDALLAAGLPCLNLRTIIPDNYYGFQGVLYFSDMQGKENPRSDGLGSRWLLFYNDEI